MAPRAKKNPKHYVDNKLFYVKMKEYKLACFACEEKHAELCASLREDNPEIEDDDLPTIVYPRVTEYLGKCFWLIATRLASSPRFYSYTYKDEMIADGYEDCVLRVRGFNHEKYSNPFAYFTQISYFAFLRRWKKENKQKMIKSEMIKNSNALHYFDNGASNGEDQDYVNGYMQFLLDNMDHIESDSEKENKKHIKVKTTKAHQEKLKQQEALDEQERDRIVRIEKEELHRMKKEDILDTTPDSIDEYMDFINEEEYN